jgi:hypothetical protein
MRLEFGVILLKGNPSVFSNKHSAGGGQLLSTQRTEC